MRFRSCCTALSVRLALSASSSPRIVWQDCRQSARDSKAQSLCIENSECMSVAQCACVFC